MRVYEAVITTDVRDVLPSIKVPTLVMHRIADAMPIEGALYIVNTSLVHVSLNCPVLTTTGGSVMQTHCCAKSKRSSTGELQ